MTNREKILSLVKAYETDVNTLDGALIDAGLDPVADYVAEVKAQVNEAAVFVLQTVRRVRSVSEGGYSVTYEDDLASLIQTLGGGPTVTAARVW